MDEERKEELIQSILDHYRPDIVSADQETSPEENAVERLRHDYALRRLIDHYFDIYSLDVTAQDLQKDIYGILTELHTEEIADTIEPVDGVVDATDEPPGSVEHYPTEKSVDENGLVEVFEAKINAVKADLGRADKIEFTIWFPWHVLWRDNPDSLAVYDFEIEPVSGDGWKEVLDSVARDPDHPDGAELQYKIEEEEDYDLWKTSVSAYSPHSAFIRFRNGLQLLSAQLNHSQYGLTIAMRRDRDGIATPNHRPQYRWTSICKPLGMFWEDDRVDETRGVDHGFHGAHVYSDEHPPKAVLSYEAMNEKLQRHTTHEGAFNHQDAPIHDALIEYQNELTAESHDETFFSFWQIIEKLSRIGRQQSKSDAIDRALFALDVTTGGENAPVINQVADDIWDARNDWVHNPGRNDIEQPYEMIAKILADALIELHIDQLGDLNWDMRQQVLDWGTQKRKMEEDAKSAIRRVNEILE